MTRSNPAHSAWCESLPAAAARWLLALVSLVVVAPLEGCNTASPQPAFVVRKLRESGALILGKTNLSDWANFRSKRSSSGWSGRGGQTRNPTRWTETPSAPAPVPPSPSPLTSPSPPLGTETNGSIVCPASDNAPMSSRRCRSFVQGLPVGLSSVAGAWTEGRLIGYAYAFEQATHARQSPPLSASSH
jgi:Asp-tRNA(Asn)/Glu-tRNA(Gln) amidotransferase A subunit family amidase